MKLLGTLWQTFKLNREEGWSFGTLLHNLRFELGYAIGGFTQASRD